MSLFFSFSNTMDIFTNYRAAENKSCLPWLSSCFISILSCAWDSNYVRWKVPVSIYRELCNEQFLTSTGLEHKAKSWCNLLNCSIKSSLVNY